MELLKRHKKLHIWLAADLLVVALHWLTRHNRAWMNALTAYVTEPFKRLLGRVTNLVDFSVAELIYVVAIGCLLVWLCRSACVVARSRHKWRALYPRALGLVCTGLSIYAALTLLWGVNYYADSFQDKSGVYGRPSSAQELAELTEFFARGVQDTYAGVARDENGLFAVSREEIFDRADGIYAGLYKEFPFLELEEPRPKPLVFSWIFSAMDFTGFFFPFTGEANLNVHCPALYLPTTIVHELSHLRGIASEQECNFLAIVGAISSEDPVYQYSGWLMGYIHAGNALYRADPERWQAIRETIPDQVVADLRYHSAYWQSWEGPISEAASNAYDSFLKNYGDENGVRSYSMAVDMLVAYFIDGDRT